LLIVNDENSKHQKPNLKKIHLNTGSKLASAQHVSRKIKC